MSTRSLPLSVTTEQEITTSRVISLDITLSSYQDALDAIAQSAKRHQHGTVCFANVHMTVEAVKNPHFAQQVNSADWVVADGVPLTWAIQALYGQRQERITGLDFLPDLLQRAAQTGLSVFFYGSTPEVLEATVSTCRQNYPGLIIAGVHSPPFRELTPEEDDDVVQLITASGAQLVFVALGCPRQEAWVNRMRNRIPAILLAIGGALPVLAGQFNRAPRWMQQAGMEWFFRLAQEPRRLFRRYFVTNMLFTVYLMQNLLRKKLV